MSKLWKFLFIFTWLVIIVVLVFMAIMMSDRNIFNQNQQVINQYAVKGNGLSAYDVALKQGFVGSEREWIESLKGKDSKSTTTVVQKETETTHTVVEQVPVQGKSSYEIWLTLGNKGTENDYLLSLKGEPGQSAEVSLRFNEDLGLFQSKKATDKFWKSIPTCGGLTGRVCN